MAAKAEQLAVWMYGQQVAVLTKHQGRLALSYTEAAQASYEVNTPLLSVALPVLPGSFKDSVVRPFFDGLLPEGEARRMLAYDFRLSEDDTFGLLKALGRDCAGALIVLPEGETPLTPNATEASILTLDEVARRIRQLDTEPLGVDKQVRVSLAGVQHKLVLTRLPSGQWALPINNLPSTHILKRASRRFDKMVANEAYCLALGRRLGLSVAETDIIRWPEEVLVVTRYDRVYTENGDISRIHQEDLAQAFSLTGSAKYEEHGGPSLRQVARRLREVTGRSTSLEALLDITFLNMVVGNADAHAKNLSFLYIAPGVIQLAPAYDIVSTTFYPQVDVRPGMYVNRKTSMHDITATDLIEEAIAWGLPRNRVRARVLDLLERLPSALDAAAREVPTAPDDLLAHVQARASQFSAPLPTP
ncbi:MAG: HipA domain-containing protein [Candidatus Sericytochromatia bacterium]